MNISWSSHRFSILLSSLLATTTALTLSTPSHALTLIRNYVEPGRTLGSWRSGPEYFGNQGDGNLVDIFNAAADLWEDSILDDHTVTLNFAWSDPRNANTLGLNSLVRRDPSHPGRMLESNIIFDNANHRWFMDSTPLDNEEYGFYRESAQDLGGGLVNTGRIYTRPLIGAAWGFDLFSVALHEIGHSLGLHYTASYFAERGDGDLDITAPRLYAGTAIPFQENGPHTLLRDTIMYPSFGRGMRKDLSAVDILANGELSDFTRLNLEPRSQQSVPEAGLGLWGSLAGLVGFRLLGRRRSAK
jgi:hypothetical protein